MLLGVSSFSQSTQNRVCAVDPHFVARSPSLFGRTPVEGGGSGERERRDRRISDNNDYVSRHNWPHVEGKTGDRGKRWVTSHHRARSGHYDELLFRTCLALDRRAPFYLPGSHPTGRRSNRVTPGRRRCQRNFTFSRVVGLFTCATLVRGEPGKLAPFLTRGGDKETVTSLHNSVRLLTSISIHNYFCLRERERECWSGI